jgi:hypothetical protein
MPTFKDAKGRSWEVVVSVDTIKRLRSMLEVDLLKVIEPENDVMRNLLLDPIYLANVLYVTVRPEADRLKVTDEDFGQGLFGEALDAAMKAFMEALADFFRGPVHRTALKEMVARVFETERKAAVAVKERIDAGELDRAIAEEVALQPQRSSGSSGSLPERSESTPAP